MSQLAAIKSVTAANQFTDAVRLQDQDFSISITGSFTATVTVQRKLPFESEWADVESFQEVTAKNGECVGNWDYRIGVKTGDFTSGPVDVKIAA